MVQRGLDPGYGLGSGDHPRHPRPGQVRPVLALGLRGDRTGLAVLRGCQYLAAELNLLILYYTQQKSNPNIQNVAL